MNCSFAAVNCSFCSLFTFCGAHCRTVFSSARVAAALRHAAISEHLVAVSSAFTDVAQKVRYEDCSGSMPLFSAEFSALNFTIKSSIYDNPTNTKLSHEWEFSLSFYTTPMLKADFVKHQKYLRMRGHNDAF